jgi:hypothetical protein
MEEKVLKSGQPLLVGVLIGITCLLFTSCAGDKNAQIEDSLVQIWQTNSSANGNSSLLASGLVVGDGSEVLTFLNYEENFPEGLSVIAPGKDPIHASIQSIDPRTSATILKITGAKLPAASIGQAGEIPLGQIVTIRYWYDFDGLRIRRNTATTSPNQVASPLFFSAIFESAASNSPSVDQPGSIVTDESGNLLGIESTFYLKLVAVLGPIGRIPPIINISSVGKLVSTNLPGQGLTGKPVISVLATKSGRIGYFAGVLPPPADYDGMVSAVNSIIGQTGTTTEFKDVVLNQRSDWWQNLDGTLLILVYPEPIDLLKNGQLLDKAKWIGIEWARESGRPSRLVFGSIPYEVQGAYELNVDFTSLSAALGLAH